MGTLSGFQFLPSREEDLPSDAACQEYGGELESVILPGASGSNFFTWILSYILTHHLNVWATKANHYYFLIADTEVKFHRVAFACCKWPKLKFLVIILVLVPV